MKKDRSTQKNRVPLELKWTNEIPTEQGWYWILTPYGFHAEPILYYLSFKSSWVNWKKQGQEEPVIEFTLMVRDWQHTGQGDVPVESVAGYDRRTNHKMWFAGPLEIPNVPEEFQESRNRHYDQHKDNTYFMKYQAKHIPVTHLTEEELTKRNQTIERLNENH